MVEFIRWRLAARALQVVIHPAHQPQGIVVAGCGVAVAVHFIRVNDQANRRVGADLYETIHLQGLARMNPRIPVPAHDQ